MKKLLLTICIAIAMLQATMAQDVIVTKQSERIDAKILEVSESTVKYKKQSNPTGPTFSISTSKIASVIYANGEVQTFEPAEPEKKPAVKYNHLYRGLEVGVSAGASIYFSQYGNSASFIGGLTVGRRFNENFYAGLFAGYIPAGEAIQLMALARTYIPLGNTKFEFSPEVGLGMGINGGTVDGFALQVVPSLQIPVSPKLDMRVGAGVNVGFADAGAAATLLINAGLSMHGSTSPDYVKPSTLKSGLQLSIDGLVTLSKSYSQNIVRGGGIIDNHVTVPGGYLSPVLMYKYDPHLSFGIGFGFGVAMYSQMDCDVHITFSPVVDRYGHYVSEPTRNIATSTIQYSFDSEVFDMFLRCQYRFLDRRLSPFVSLDFGLVTTSAYLDNGWSIDESHDMSYTSLEISPSFGVSWRVGHNTYLDLKCRYSWAPGSPAIDDRVIIGDGYESYGEFMGSYNYECTNHSLSLSHFYVGIGFTQTFDVLQRK